MTRSNKWAWGFIAVFLAILAVSIATFQRPYVRVTEEYRDDEYGFSIFYPESWEVRHDVGEAVVAFLSPREEPSDETREGAMVVVIDVEEDTVLDDSVMQELYDGMQELGTDFGILESGRVRINGLDARRVVCTLRQDPRVSQYLIYVFAKGERLYLVTSVAHPMSYDRYEAVFEKISYSMEIH